jgi:Predicted endonuclease distantly related to archaeal Holliday junction resolvase
MPPLSLERLGYTIIARNYTARAIGELDIIAMDGPVLVFCEIKTRSSLQYGHAAEALTPTKCRRIILTSQHFMYTRNLDDLPVRYDVLEVYPNRIEHIKNAFDATDIL